MRVSLRQFQKFDEKSRNAKCPYFCIQKCNANCLDFCEVSGFCILKRHVTQSVMLFVYKCQFQNVHEKLCNLKCPAFCI